MRQSKWQQITKSVEPVKPLHDIAIKFQNNIFTQVNGIILFNSIHEKIARIQAINSRII